MQIIDCESNVIISTKDLCESKNRKIIISTEDLNYPAFFYIKDEYGNAGTNNITVTLDTSKKGGAIDGHPEFVIDRDNESIFLWVADEMNAYLLTT